MKLKKTIWSVLACVLACVMTFAIAACSNNKPDDKDGKATITAISILETAQTEAGSTVNVITEIKYSDGTSKKTNDSDIEWSSSNENVATVTRGIVSGKAKGTATITAKAGEVSSNACTVTVISGRVVTVLQDGKEISTLKLEKDASTTLTAKVTRDGAEVDGQEIEWSTSDKKVADVNANGTVTAWAKGNATITATVKGASIKAEIPVEVTWTEPVGYKPVEWAEQNKLISNAWGYWNAKDPGWANGALATDNDFYTEEYTENPANLKAGFQYIGMGKATMDYEVTSMGVIWSYQVFYRSSDNVEGGKLAYNHDYELTFKLNSNVAGTIGVNPYDDIRGKNEEETDEEYNAYLVAQETAGKIKLAKDTAGAYVLNDNGHYTTDHEININKGENVITVIFRHDDCGYVYKQGIYDNMGSALHLQLGHLEGRVQLSVYDFQYKDLGAADNPVTCDETKHDGYVDPDRVDPLPQPERPTAHEEADVTATKLSLKAEDNKAVIYLEGNIDLSKFENSTEVAKTWLTATPFDMQQCGGSWISYGANRLSVEVNANGTFLIKYDITYMPVDTAGTGAYTCHFTGKVTWDAANYENEFRDVKLDAEHAVPGESVTVGNKKYSIVNNVGGSDQASNWGCVAIKVENV